MKLHELDEHLQEMTPHQLKLIQAIYDSGDDWLTRSKVAKAIGKRRLTPYDIECLKMLSDKCLIETSTQPTTAPGSDFAYIYHMPNTVADVLKVWSEERVEDAQTVQRDPINLSDES